MYLYITELEDVVTATIQYNYMAQYPIISYRLFGFIKYQNWDLEYISWICKRS